MPKEGKSLHFQKKRRAMNSSLSLPPLSTLPFISQPLPLSLFPPPPSRSSFFRPPIHGAAEMARLVKKRKKKEKKGSPHDSNRSFAYCSISPCSLGASAPQTRDKSNSVRKEEKSRAGREGTERGEKRGKRKGNIRTGSKWGVRCSGNCTG